MSDNPLSAALSNKVKIGGREIPVVVLGGGIGLVAAVAALVSRRNAPQTAAAEVTQPAEQGQSFADQFTTFSQGISQQVSSSLAEQSAAVASQFSSFQAGFQNQLASQQAGTSASLATITTNVNNIQSGYAALNQRVAAVEQKAAKVDTLTTVVRNMARWFYAVPNVISLANTYGIPSEGWTTAAGQVMTGITNTVAPIGGLGTIVP